MTEELAFAWAQRALLLQGFLDTVWLAAAGGLLALALGAPLAVALTARRPGLRLLAGWLVDLVRAVPFLLLACIVHFGLPRLGLRAGAATAGLLALGLCHGAAVGELLREAWARLPPDLEQAARAFGFSGARLRARILLPAAASAAAPALAGQLVRVVTDSAFVVLLGAPELTSAAVRAAGPGGLGAAPLLLAALALYWLLGAAAALGAERAERFAGLRR